MAKHKIYAFCNESLKYKIKNHRTFKFRCHEIRNDDTWQILNLKFQLLYSEFRELNSMFFFHIKLHFMEHFCVAIWLLEPQANYVLWPHISHLNEPDIYILSHIYANSKGQDKPAIYVVSPKSLLPIEDKTKAAPNPLDWCACILRMCNQNNHKLFTWMQPIHILFNLFLTIEDVLHVLIVFPNRLYPYQARHWVGAYLDQK